MLAELHVQEYYNAGLDQRFFKNYGRIENHDPAESHCLDKTNGEVFCLDYYGSSSNDDGSVHLNRLCYSDIVDLAVEASHFQESEHNPSFVFNGQYRFLNEDASYIELFEDIVHDLCQPLFQRKDLVSVVPLGPTNQVPAKACVQTFIDFDSIETCDGCSPRKGGWV
ncbi:MAG: hypothetical protein Q9166_001013 [cf. Caloplaca sp. 2 TL-2023]